MSIWPFLCPSAPLVPLHAAHLIIIIIIRPSAFPPTPERTHRLTKPFPPAHSDLYMLDSVADSIKMMQWLIHVISSTAVSHISTFLSRPVNGKKQKRSENTNLSMSSCYLATIPSSRPDEEPFWDVNACGQWDEPAVHAEWHHGGSWEMDYWQTHRSSDGNLWQARAVLWAFCARECAERFFSP